MEPSYELLQILLPRLPPSVLCSLAPVSKDLATQVAATWPMLLRMHRQGTPGRQLCSKGSKRQVCAWCKNKTRLIDPWAGGAAPPICGGHYDDSRINAKQARRVYRVCDVDLALLDYVVTGAGHTYRKADVQELAVMVHGPRALPHAR